jgi:hypothetical protein
MSFHVPEKARVPGQSSAADGNNGAFALPSNITGWALFIIAADGTQDADKPEWQWEHVSVQAVNQDGRSRIPRWMEMCYVKETFWDAEDVVMQLHPRESEYVDNHPAVLHLWRPKLHTIPTPPKELV